MSAVTAHSVLLGVSAQSHGHWLRGSLTELAPSDCGVRVDAQGFLQGASFDTTGTITPDGLSPGASPPQSHAPMSWQQNLDGNPFFPGPAALQQPVDA